MSSVADTRGGSGRGAAPGRAVKIAADGLRLAAAPTFAAMALLTAAFGSGQPDILCASGHTSALGGMVPMYGLMSAFHLAPWLRLIAGRRFGSKER